MLRARNSTTGPNTHDQSNCHTIDGHLGHTSASEPNMNSPVFKDFDDAYHSQPTACFDLTSQTLPDTSVPGMPKDEWNFLERRHMKRTKKICRQAG